MSKKKSLIWYSIIGIFILMQVYPVSQPEVVKENPNDLLVTTQVPDNIAVMLKESCYDCHSNETIYPWYSYVAPVKWLVNRDTRLGREELNFSNWASMSKMDRATALSDISDEVSEGDMPMKIYPIMHAEAKLSDEDRQAIVDWADELTEALFD
ncbi:MAG: heme-binding domain-containing protein [Bacteroidales bacterium]|nr:heme-binding domain-containing protein [Bacteroidales bacterium]